MTDAGSGVIGREAELAAVLSFTDEVSVPRALVLDGAPGIGKTTLWEAGTVRSRPHCSAW